jgi:hypothetical protein
LRYLKSHGPALAQDLAWWSGLTLADAKRGIQACGAALSSASVDGKNYWFTPLGRATPHTTPVVQLLPNYDELLVAYRKRDEIAAPELVKHFGPRENLLFSNLVSVDGKLVGSFRRELGKSQVAVKVSLLRQLSAAERRELRAAAERYAAFLGVGLALSLEPTS